MTAQTFCLNLEVVSNTATELIVAVQVNGSAAFQLGSSNLLFEFDNVALSNPVLEENGLSQPPSYFLPTVTTPKVDEVSFNIVLGFPGFSDAMSGPLGWTEVGKIKFTKTGMPITIPFSWLYNGGTTETVAFVDDAQVTQIYATELSCLQGIPVSALPVTYLYFDAKKQGKIAKLEWQTAMEENNYGFHVQHSTDSRTFETIGFVEGKRSQFEYEFIHNKPQNGINYYRLEQEDFDGKTEFTSIKNVVFNENSPSWNIYPNPVAEKLYVGGLIDSAEIIFSLYDVTGRVVMKQRGGNALNVSHLPTGLYSIEVSQDAVKSYNKVIIGR